MQTSNRTLQIALLLMAIVDSALAYIYLFDPATVSSMFGGVQLDAMHLYFSVAIGCLLITFALGALLTMFRPAQRAAIVLLLILSHFSLFIADIVALARNQLAIMSLLPQMGYYLAICVLLIRFFPTTDAEDAKEAEDAKDEAETDSSASHASFASPTSSNDPEDVSAELSK